MATKLPRHIIQGIKHIERLSGEVFNAFVEAFRSTPSARYPTKLAREFTTKVDLPEDELLEAIGAALSLFLARTKQEEIAQSDFPREVAKAFYIAEKIEADEEQLSVLAERIERLFAIQPLAVSAKTLNLIGEVERRYASARVVTDIRPVFGDKEDCILLASAIIHTLQVTYFENGDRKEFFVALDAADLVKLRDSSARAVKKEGVLKETLSTTTFKNIEA